MPRICCYDVKEGPSQLSQEINVNTETIVRIFCIFTAIFYINFFLDNTKICY